MNEDTIIMAHGGGGQLTQRLISEHIVPRIGNPLLDSLDDGAIIDISSDKICMTTDSFVVDPIEFPGGDIGHLAVCGTVNDLAVSGADPLALSLGLILEEGLALSTLDRILDSIAETAEAAGVAIATGDTKVIERRSSVPSIMINTTGIGQLRGNCNLDTGRITVGDTILINGPVAEHGIAVMSAREGLAFETEVRSDAACLNHLVSDLLETGGDVKFLRDPTRGGIAGVLADLVADTGLGLEAEESEIPVTPAVRGACEMLGLDPIEVANEGKVVAVTAPESADAALKAMHNNPLGRQAAIIGRFTDAAPPLAELLTRAGGRRVINRPYGEQLPRIC